MVKIQVKVNTGKDFIFSHFCYVPSDVKDRFDKYVNIKGLLSNHWIGLWAASEFDMTSIDTAEDIKELRNRIRESFKERYPELYIASNIDKQGWLRVWYTENMERELEKVGK